MSVGKSVWLVLGAAALGAGYLGLLHSWQPLDDQPETRASLLWQFSADPAESSPAVRPLPAEVELDERKDRLGKQLFVKVADTGIGIPPDKAETIFEQFSQVDGSSTCKHEGTGLGIAVCKRLVGKMGARSVSTARLARARSSGSLCACPPMARRQ